MEMLASSALSIFDHMEPGALAYCRLSNEEATCTAPGHGLSQDFQTGCLFLGGVLFFKGDINILRLQL